MQKKRDPIIGEAIDLCGSQEALAAAMGCSQQTISRLFCCHQRPTAEQAILLERATSGAVMRERVRPDLFAPPAPSEAAG